MIFVRACFSGLSVEQFVAINIANKYTNSKHLIIKRKWCMVI